MASPTTSLLQAQLQSQLQQTRQRTEQICSPLQTEDFVVQTCFEVSPVKWHLAHTTWFWEHFILQHHLEGYPSFHPQFHYLFNSYYETEGQVFNKGFRGAQSRPTVAEIYSYRRHVDEAMGRLLAQASEQLLAELEPMIRLGMAHEEQHQELMLMDIKHIFSSSPLLPSYRISTEPHANGNNGQAGNKGPTAAQEKPATWHEFEGGVVEVGYDGDGFCFDNEQPRHSTFLPPFALQNRLVTNQEFLAFIDAGGYRDSRYWLADGWDTIQEEGWTAPLYWHQDQHGHWWEFTLDGLQPLHPRAPVIHLSFYEAHAYATWQGYRLPEEAEWEVAARQQNISEGNFYEDGALRGQPATPGDGMRQMFGDAWEWTQSAYKPYPGYKNLYEGTGEYNGKFMLNQLVMRGGCCFTPRPHIRSSYRNFFYPRNRWQVSGLRLAKTL